MPGWTHANLSGGTTQYWFENPNPTSKYIGTAFDENWGEYGPSPYTYSEWSQASQRYITVTDSPEIASGQIAEAAGYTAGMLMAVSQSLPPLIATFTVTSDAVNSPTGAGIEFVLLENRLPDVKIDLFVQETGQTIVTSGLMQRLPNHKSDKGAEYYDYFPGAAAWSAKDVSLYPTLSSDLTLLPQMAVFQLAWSGEVEGTALTPRDIPYTLVLRVTDQDVNQDESQYRFSVMSDTAPPTVFWETPGPDGVPIHDQATGSNTPETAPWFHIGYSTSAPVTFWFDDAGTGVGNFSIYPAVGAPETPLFSADFRNGQSFMLSDFTLPDDATGYMMSAADTLGNATTVYFHLDRRPPEVHISGIVIQKGMESYSIDIQGMAKDATAGLAGPVRLTATPSVVGAPPGAPSQFWPPGPKEGSFSFPNLQPSNYALGANALQYMVSVYDRSGLSNYSWVPMGYDILTGPMSQPESQIAPFILKRAELTVEEPPLSTSTTCGYLDAPLGRYVEVLAEPRAPTQSEISNLNNLLSSFSGVDVVHAYVPKSESFHVFDPVYSPVVRVKYFDEVMPRFVNFNVISHGNTNSVRYRCFVDSDEDGVEDEGEVLMSTFPPGSIRYSASLKGTLNSFKLYPPVESPAAEVIPPGLNVRLRYGNLEIIFSEVTKGGKLLIKGATNYPEVPGYRIDKNNAYDLVVQANYRDLKVKACMDTGNLSDSQVANAEIYHYNEGPGAWEKVTSGREGGCVSGVSQTASPFVVMVPVDDHTAPQTSIGFKQGGQKEANGGFYVSTDTYVNYYADDVAIKGDISGVATIYNLINVEPSPECRAVPFDPGAQKGTCANPLYKAPFKLTEGLYTLHYFSSDKASNFESPKTARVYADGTPPIAALTLDGAALVPETTAYLTETQALGLSAEDPASNGVSSGLKDMVFTIDTSLDDCQAAPDFAGPAGTCRNPRYTAPFTLSIGTHTVYYSAVDNVGNKAAVKSASVTVGLATKLSVSGKTAKSITWEWVSVAFAAAYQIFSSTGGTLSEELPSGATWFIQAGLAPNTAYGAYLSVRFAGKSFSTLVSSAATLANPPGAPEVFAIGQYPSIVIGQNDLVSVGQGGTQNGLSSPMTAIADAAGNLWVSDWANRRILRFPGLQSTGMNADLVIGQADFTSNESRLARNRFYDFPTGMAFDGSGALWAAEGCRILRFSPPFFNGMDADLVLGAGDFTSCFYGVGANTVGAWGIKFDGSGNLWVADADNNRVLRFNPPFTSGQAASLVLGQSLFTTNSAAWPAHSGSFSHPRDIAFDSRGRAFVGDFNNNRVLVFEPPLINGMAASVVIGQDDFSSLDMTVAQNRINGPNSVALDGYDNLYVADTRNNRVVKFRPPFSTGMNASLVLGQPDFNTTFNMNTANSFRTPFEADIAGFITSDSQGRLWVTDTGNNRVLAFEPVHSGIFSDVSANGFVLNWLGNDNPSWTDYKMEISRNSDFSEGVVKMEADASLSSVFGGLQSNSKYYARSRAINLEGAGTSWTGLNFTFTKPLPASGLEGVSGGYSSILWKWLPEAGLKYQLFASTGGAVSGVLTEGTSSYLQTGLDPNRAYAVYIKCMNQAGTADSAPAFETTLSAPPKPVEPFVNGQSASVVLGQADFTSAVQGVGAGKFGWPFNLTAAPDGSLWVKDTINCRVLRFSAPQTSGQSADLVIGQSDFASAVCGTAPNKLAAGSGTSAFDAQGNLWLADASNNRVLRFPKPFSNGMSADLVLGQPDFYSKTSGITANKMSAPANIVFDSSGALWVSGGRRILRFSPPFSGNMNADLVLGQPDFTSNYSVSDSTAYSILSGMAFDSGGGLWAAAPRYGRGRLVRFSPPFTNGMAPGLVMNSPDNSTPGPSNILTAQALVFDALGAMYVADSIRVLKFNPPFSDGMNATAVIGKADFYSTAASLSDNRVLYPRDISLVLGAAGPVLWVSDPANYRALGFYPVASSFSDVFASSAVMRWGTGANPPGAGYQAQLSAGADFTSIAQTSPWVETDSFLFTDLAESTTYYGRVRSRNSRGVESAYSYTGSFLTPQNVRYITTESSAIVNGVPEVVFVSTKTSAVALISTTTGSGAFALGSAQGAGIGIVSGLYEIGPEGVYDPPAILTFSYSPEAAAMAGISEGDLAVYEYFAGSGWVKLAGQVPDTGTHRISVQVSNIASLFGVFGEIRDRAAPVTELIVSGAEYMAGGRVYASTAAVFAFTAADPVVYGTSTGVAFTEYRVSPSTPQVFTTYAGPFTLAAGKPLLEYRSADRAGNIEAVKSAEFYIDGSAPETAAVVYGVHGSDGWYVSTTSLILTAMDGMSGVAGTHYSINGGDFSVYLSTMVFEADGLYGVRYYSKDNVQNIEVEKAAHVRVDKTPPLAGLNAANAFYQNGKRYVSGNTGYISIESTDAVSGVETVYYQVLESSDSTVGGLSGDTTGLFNIYTGTFTLEDGEHLLISGARDKAGNYGGLKSDIVYFDNTPPATSLAHSGPVYTSEGGVSYVSGAGSITLSAEDPLAGNSASGIRATVYLVNGASAAYTAPFKLADGYSELGYYSFDNTGNQESVKTAVFNVDARPPVTQAMLNGVPVEGGVVAYAAEGASITLAAVDPSSGTAASGLARIWYSLEANGYAGGMVQYSGVIALSTGTNNISYYAVDNVGNVEAAKTARVSIGGSPVVKLKLEPETLNLGSKGEDITGKLKIEGGKTACFNRSSINISAVNGHDLETPIYAMGAKDKHDDGHGRGDRDDGEHDNDGRGDNDWEHDGRNDDDKDRGEGHSGHNGHNDDDDSRCGSITVKFDRADVIAVLPGNAKVKVTVSGKFTDGRSFSADDTIRTIKPAADPAFRLGAVYVSPNPAKGGKVPVFHIETGIADRVNIIIRTVSGMITHEHTMTGMPKVSDKGGDPVYVYEYAWDGRIAGGIYHYTIEAEKAGQKLKNGGMLVVVR